MIENFRETYKSSPDHIALEELKNELLLCPPECRSVEKWNEFRKSHKKTYSITVLAMLDSSGFINKWLKG
jgi:hypothetical protein